MGIRRYVNVVKSVEREFQPKTGELNNLQARIKALADEITKLRGATVVDPSTIKAKQDEGERLQREYEYKKQQYTSDFEKRLSETTVPVSNEIMKALDQFAAARGITLTLDLTRLAPAILTMVPALDITQAFIADYNSKNP
jgi:Skp family chaperone for outer membrane proteins